MTTRQTFRVVFARDDNDTWFVDAIDVPGAHSHGRTLEAARRNIREAIALVLEIDDEESFDLDELIRFPDEHVQSVVDRAIKLRVHASEADSAAQDAAIEALNALAESTPGVSIRDLSELLHLPQGRTRKLLESSIRAG